MNIFLCRGKGKRKVKHSRKCVKEILEMMKKRDLVFTLKITKFIHFNKKKKETFIGLYYTHIFTNHHFEFRFYRHFSFQI